MITQKIINKRIFSLRSNMRFEYWTFSEETRTAQLKREFAFRFVSLICCFSKSDQCDQQNNQNQPPTIIWWIWDILWPHLKHLVVKLLLIISEINNLCFLKLYFVMPRLHENKTTKMPRMASLSFQKSFGTVFFSVINIRLKLAISCLQPLRNFVLVYLQILQPCENCMH